MNYFDTLPVLLKDFYKVGHPYQYVKGTSMVSSNLTARNTRVPEVPGIIVAGIQYFIQEYLVNQFTHDFFEKPRGEVVSRYRRRVNNALGPGPDYKHIGELHELGYLPLMIKSIDEGRELPYRVPYLTIRNTEEDFFWLTNMLETVMSCVLWLPITSATTAFQYRKVFEAYARKTGVPREFVKWQGHDFSMRGMEGIEGGALSGLGHLFSFTGTDTIPAIDLIEQYYYGDSDKEMIGGSVAATEHSVMCMGMKDGELETFKRLITEVYPSGIVSIVSDTWDLWQVLTEYMPLLRNEILQRDGKLVIRPDSGDPVLILCGDPNGATEAERAGVVQLLWDVFAGQVNGAGYKVLDQHVGSIYGDSITRARQDEILGRLAANGFASSNVVLGIGSFTYQYVTRDTYGQAMKATYGEVEGVGRSIFKSPKTDDGVKNSARGLLRVAHAGDDPRNPIICQENVTWEQERTGMLTPRFINGKVMNTTTIGQIRARIERNL